MHKTRKMAVAAKLAGALGLVLSLALLTACSGKPAADAATPSNAPAPTIKLVTPEYGAELPAGDVNVAVETTDLKFVMPNNKPVPGEGHVHFKLDDRPIVMSDKPEAVLKDVEPGSHRLDAELVQNDTKPFDPPVKVEIEFTVK